MISKLAPADLSPMIKRFIVCCASLFLFAFVFAISSAQLSSNERAALTIAAAGKADLQHAVTIPVPFEELWGGVAYDKASPADERMAHWSAQENESDWSLEARAVGLLARRAWWCSHLYAHPATALATRER